MDAHVVLGIQKDASEEQIRAAYKALAMKWHPDRQLNHREEATAKFVEINKANRTMLRNLRRARRSAESSSSSCQSGSSPSSPKTTSSSLPETFAERTRPSNSRTSTSQSIPESTHSSSSGRGSTFSASPSSTSSSIPTQESLRGRTSSRSSSPLFPSSSSTDTPSKASTSTSSPKHDRSRLRKQSKSRNCRPDPLTGEYTPKSHPRRRSTATTTASLGPERVEETLHPLRSILRGAGADAPKKWVHVLNMSLEDVHLGKTFHFRVVRYKRSGKKSVVPLDLHVAPGTRPGTEIVVDNAGNERKDGSTQSIVFFVKEKKHERFRRVHDDLLMELRVPWVDSLNEQEGEVFFKGIDGTEHMFRVDYRKGQSMSGTTIIAGAGMSSRDGIGRGRAIIRWEISSPSSSWGAIKQVLKFKD